MSTVVSPVATADDHAALAERLGRAARAASLKLAGTPTEQKHAALDRLATLIEQAGPALAEANARDLAAGEAAGLTTGLCSIGCASRRPESRPWPKACAR